MTHDFDCFFVDSHDIDDVRLILEMHKEKIWWSEYNTCIRILDYLKTHENEKSQLIDLLRASLASIELFRNSLKILEDVGLSINLEGK